MSIEERVLRLENAFTILVELAQSTDERMDDLIAAQVNSEAKIAALADAQIQTEGALKTLTQRVTELTDAQAHTDRRLDALIDIMREARGDQT